MRIWDRNSSVVTQVSEEGGAAVALGARAANPLQAMLQTVVKQDVPLQPMDI